MGVYQVLFKALGLKLAQHREPIYRGHFRAIMALLLLASD
jgi:hypothetical protein